MKAQAVFFIGLLSLALLAGCVTINETADGDSVPEAKYTALSDKCTDQGYIVAGAYRSSTGKYEAVCVENSYKGQVLAVIA